MFESKSMSWQHAQRLKPKLMIKIELKSREKVTIKKCEKPTRTNSSNKTIYENLQPHPPTGNFYC